MALTVQQMRPVAPVPLGLGVVRRVAIAPVSDRRSAPHPAPVLAPGRGVAALSLAILAGDQALDTVGQRLADRGMLALWQAGFSRAALDDDRLGPIRAALFAATLQKVLSAGVLQAWEV
jgi:hypothetical protein